ncbi:MAG: hypothetical protein FRX49_00137 [Trebouxia sp. A1-2]|nr:MAG: hypothetical protein FRX49_00137 [Trebouxia sp. A1-2]
MQLSSKSFQAVLIPRAQQASRPRILHVQQYSGSCAPVQERVHCYKCFVSTHEHYYTQAFYNVMAKGVEDQEACLPGRPLGHTLRELESHSLKSCDDGQGTVRLSHAHCLLLLCNFCVEGGCGVRNWVLHPLMSQPPKVFTLQLAWQTDNESKLDIKAALVGLREGLDLADVYLGIAMVAFNTMYAVWSVIMVNTT